MAFNHILVVEDEHKIASILKEYLEQAGFEVSCLFHGNGVVPFVKSHAVDLILLDIMLPGKNGIDVCKEIRNFSTVPILMVTAKTEEIDRLLGLELGADDYICKPFSPREVVARVKMVLRRLHPSAPYQETLLTVGPIVLNETSRQVRIHDEELKLTPNEFALLKTLMSHPGRVFPRNDLLNQVQGYDFDGYDRTIDTHIKNLRKKIAVYLPHLEIINSVYGVGYRFNPKDL
ncbi:response regulator [Deltaproteobacteria bacterium TL4]